ncbi:hypothetical protein Sjap_003959 [Stephania japonica]|uniref:Cullin-like alpha+beta domain-containing protein n=1 Tax=Stephania japonica TaxID=461633 RepID=A0AAP0PKF5_9MAGN
MCIHMLFNNADRPSYKEIERGNRDTNLDLKRSLRSLALIKGKNVLRKEPMSKDIGEDDAFFFNDKFTSKFIKLKINTMNARKESSPRSETRQRVEEDRNPKAHEASPAEPLESCPIRFRRTVKFEKEKEKDRDFSQLLATVHTSGERSTTS